MKLRALSSALALAAITLAGAFAAAAPNNAPITGGAQPITPVGTLGSKPVIAPGLVKTVGGLTIVPTTQLGLESLTTGATTCTPAHSSTLPIRATIQVFPGQASPTKNVVDILVNGVSQGAQPVTITTLPNSTNGYVQISRTIPLPNMGGDASIQFVLNGTQRTPVRRVHYGCITFQPQPVQMAPISLPDIAIPEHPFVIIAYWPPVYHQPPSFCFADACPLPPPDYPNWWYEIDSATEIIAPELNRTVNIPMTGRNCPRPVDAFVTLTIFYPFTAHGADPPDGYTADFRGGSTAVRPGYTAFPPGYFYMQDSVVVPCGRDIPIDFALDPRNVVRESNETNNAFHFRVNTSGP